MLHNSPRISKDIVHEIIRDIERRRGFHLCIEDFDFLTDTVVDFIHRAIDKFIAGAKEHEESSGDFVGSVDHASEINNEAIDLIFYGSANKRKQQCKSKP